ncbi:MAG: DUF3108 domain-containing protein [Pseudomonadota bacterium]
MRGKISPSGAGSAGWKRSPLAWALIFSLALHLVLLLGPPLPLPELRLAPPQDTKLDIVLPAPRPRAAMPKQPPRPHPAKPQRRQPAAPSQLPPAAAVPDPAPDAPAGEATEAAAANAVAPEENEAAAPAEPADLLPKSAQIRYILYKGRDGLAVGRVTQSWNLADNRYTLTNVMEATGPFSLFFSGKHVQISQGEVTADGLRPASYWVQRGQATESTDTARFDWKGMTLAFGTGGNIRTVRLPDNTQDLMSFLYQLAFAPPQGSDTALFITNGRKLDRYAYRPLGEETLETPMGPLKTLHIGKLQNPGEEGTEIWLATEYHYLPVKIRHIDKNGDSAEQAATEIRLQ